MIFQREQFTVTAVAAGLSVSVQMESHREGQSCFALCLKFHNAEWDADTDACASQSLSWQSRYFRSDLTVQRQVHRWLITVKCAVAETLFSEVFAWNKQGVTAVLRCCAVYVDDENLTCWVKSREESLQSVAETRRGLKNYCWFSVICAAVVWIQLTICPPCQRPLFWSFVFFFLGGGKRGLLSFFPLPGFSCRVKFLEWAVTVSR